MWFQPDGLVIRKLFLALLTGVVIDGGVIEWGKGENKL